MSSTTQRSTRSPMKSLSRHDNIPLSSQKPIQLGIEVFTKKREREKFDSSPNDRIKKIKNEIGEPVATIPQQNGTDKEIAFCHQCRQPTQTSQVVQCTVLRRFGSVSIPISKRCGWQYCNRCLVNRYHENIAIIRGQHGLRPGHVNDAGYTWSCPCCREICNCSTCRKKAGLAPLGYHFLKYVSDSDV
jgi:hypothetical protein